MSWKNTDPLELWKSSTTLPIPVQPKEQKVDEEGGQKFVEEFGNQRTRIWSSINARSTEEREEYFVRLVKIWPFPWEKRAITLPKDALAAAVVFNTGYIMSKISADVFMLDKRLNWWKQLQMLPTRFHVVMASCSTLVATWSCDHMYWTKPYLEREEAISSRQMFWRAAAIVLGNGVLAPLLLGPPIANAENDRILKKLGQRPPHITHVVDLITMCWESMRPVIPKLPILIAANTVLAFVATTALVWGRSRIHSTMEVDAELVREMMVDCEKKLGQHSLAYRVLVWTKTCWDNTIGATKFGQMVPKSVRPIVEEKTLLDEAIEEYERSLPLAERIKRKWLGFTQRNNKTKENNGHK